MKVDSKNIIRYLLDRIPELRGATGFDKNKPDFDEDYIKWPYVAFGMFLPFLHKNKNILKNFLYLIGEIYENTQDQELIGLIRVEIFEDCNDIGKDNILSLPQKKIVKDFKEYLSDLEKNSIWYKNKKIVD
jgi:hypothetical protein